MNYSTSLPKTVGVREVQRHYKAVSQNLQKQDVILVMNQNQPDMFLVSLERYEQMRNTIQQIEMRDALEAVTEAKIAQKNGQLKPLSSLKKLVNKKA